MARKRTLQNSELEAGQAADAISEIETVSEVFPDLLLEAVADPQNPHQLLLHSWDGRRAKTTRRVEHGGVVYIPNSSLDGLARWIRFAPPSEPYGSSEKVIASLTEFLLEYASLLPETRNLLIAFVMATWFCDCMPVAPVLYLFGPDAEVSHVLRLLGCCCRRPLLLGDLDFESLGTLPRGLGATLLVNQRDLGRGVKRALLASNRRQFCVIRRKKRLELYGGKAFSTEHWPFEAQGFRVSVPPAQDPRPWLSDSAEEAIATKLQAMLLRYRLDNYNRLVNGTVDCSVFAPEVREQAATWLLPTSHCAKLHDSLEAELLRQSQEVAEHRFVDVKCLVVEAALFFCHRAGVENFFIAELTQYVNALLVGRHEEAGLSARKIGSVLREVGLQAKRVTEGYKIILTDAVRERIHGLAHAYQVPPIADGVQRCRFCRKQETTAPTR